MTDAADGTFIRLSPGVQRLLEENGVSLKDIIGQHSFAPGEVQQVADPGLQNEGTKEVATIILASAAAVAVLTPLIIRAIDTISRRPVVVEDVELAPTLDVSGKPVLSRTGQPVLYWKRTKRLLEAQPNETSVSTSVKGPGIEITLGA
ncbi:hypothetical protein [Bradyrhizobium liaoningense]|uniref:hypothetical protein n=1 Tax=Bradyrhizobium liaoningense TaxID=43992 RepID=UPI001BA8A039|nr:hypothetical protein [Bradyrhizobium liaoningense]MBR0948577.1 hypothetical protein [Bradyrhizobium liaoningense]